MVMGAVRFLSRETTNGLSGRATIMWAVVKRDDMQREGKNKTYVLKQFWRPSDTPSEGEFYGTLKEADNEDIKNQYYSGEDIMSVERYEAAKSQTLKTSSNAYIYISISLASFRVEFAI
ncbi:hypothetical protein BDZ97DRAFT_212944 [Flammula alnicola]|nr:hypothetical protein BDZ97DRAFT_212944 [Flammula alnicola]